MQVSNDIPNHYIICYYVCMTAVEKQAKALFARYFEKFGKFSCESDLKKLEKLFIES